MFTGCQQTVSRWLNRERMPRIYMTQTRRQFLQNSAAALSGLALSGCGWTLGGNPFDDSGDDDIEPPMTQTSASDLYIYTWADYIDSELIETFRKQTGIRVIVDIFDSNEAMLAKVQAGGGGAYSIIYPSDAWVKRMVDLRLLQPLDHSRLNGLENLFEAFQDPEYDPGNRYSLPFTWGTTGLIYNAEKLSSTPTDWDYLWENQKALSRQVTLINDPREVLGASLRSLGYSYNSENPAEIRAAYEKLLDLKGAIATFTTDGWRDLILAGDLTMAMGYSFDAINVANENPNLKYLVPESGTSLWTDTMVIPAGAPNVAGAYKWLNFMLQPEVTVSLCERLYFATPNKKAFKQLPKELQENHTLFPPEDVIERCEVILPLSIEKEKKYARYWIKIKSS